MSNQVKGNDLNSISHNVKKPPYDTSKSALWALGFVNKEQVRNIPNILSNKVGVNIAKSDLESERKRRKK